MNTHKTLRVAAYCRVSTDKAAQKESLENQMATVRHQLTLHKHWTLVGIYADEGRSGTSIKGRPDFQRMLEDCEAGRIDYILVKSISRFARNTLDCVKLVRRMQKLGVQIYFEKENIDTGNITSEMLLVIMAFAQEESRSISENVKWGIRKRFQRGKETRVPIYGYRHTNEQLYCIVPEEAAVIQEIFTRYVHGETPTIILKDLQKRQIPPPAGDCWKLLQISRMLHNEKYIGDVILQKYFIEDHLTHRQVRNTGQLPFFHIRDAHPAIIERRLFHQAQQILSMRRLSAGNSRYPYGDMLRCPHCGQTLTHGSLHAMSKRIRNGGWGCYAPEGCRKYLLVQNVLDSALICAYRRKYGIPMERAEFYWIDDSMEEIRLEQSSSVQILWRDGESTKEQKLLNMGALRHIKNI